MFRTIKPSGRTSSSCFIPFRLISFSVLALTIILCTSKICSAQTSQNLLADPGFEEGGFVWQRVGSGWSSSTAAEASTGLESQEMAISGGRISLEVYQDVPVNGGSSYYAFGWVKTSEISGSASIMIQWLDADGNVLSSDTITVSKDTQDWVQLSGNFIAPVATDIARFRLLTNEPDGSGTAWFDDLCLLVNQPPVLNLIGDIIINEGDTLTFVPTATDPERVWTESGYLSSTGGSLTYSYSGWMTSSSYTTNYNDSGTHVVTVTVSDGALTDSQDVTVVVNDVEVSDVLNYIADITVKEGDTITINPTATNSGGETLTYLYSGWLDSDTYTTGYQDAGIYRVTVTVTGSDGRFIDAQDVTITVTDVNVAPVLGRIADITVNEGETVFLYPAATDPDYNALTYSYSGWMTSYSYTTNYLDAGVHTVTVTVSDGYLTDKQNVTVTVVAAETETETETATAAGTETAAVTDTVTDDDTGVTGGGGDTTAEDTTAEDNAAPVLDTIGDQDVSEGVTVLITPTATDSNGDDLTFSYSGWMTSDTYTTNFTDNGTYTVTVTVSDGILTDTQDVKVTVSNAINTSVSLSWTKSEDIDSGNGEVVESGTTIDSVGAVVSGVSGYDVYHRIDGGLYGTPLSLDVDSDGSPLNVDEHSGVISYPFSDLVEALKLDYDQKYFIILSAYDGAGNNSSNNTDDTKQYSNEESVIP